MLIAASLTVAWAVALEHQRSIEAAPFSSISIIGTRFEPCIGAESSINSLPKGKLSAALAADSDAETATKTKKQNERRRRRGITISGQADHEVATGRPLAPFNARLRKSQLGLNWFRDGEAGKIEP
jgi:hypothetical protein